MFSKVPSLILMVSLSATSFRPQPFWRSPIPALSCLISRQEVNLELARDAKETDFR